MKSPESKDFMSRISKRAQVLISFEGIYTPEDAKEFVEGGKYKIVPNIGKGIAKEILSAANAALGLDE